MGSKPQLCPQWPCGLRKANFPLGTSASSSVRCMHNRTRLAVTALAGGTQPSIWERGASTTFCGPCSPTHPAPRHRLGGAVQEAGRLWARSEVRALRQQAKRLLSTLSSAACSKEPASSPMGSAGPAASSASHLPEVLAQRSADARGEGRKEKSWPAGLGEGVTQAPAPHQAGSCCWGIHAPNSAGRSLKTGSFSPRWGRGVSPGESCWWVESS